jgi:hypothetical protein
MVGIVGAFMVNPENDVCVAQLGEFSALKGIRIVPGPCAIAILSDGTEDMFTEEIHPEIMKHLHDKTEMLVAHVGDDGKAVEEYTVPLSIDL